VGAVKRPHSGQFKPGNRLGGRPVGSRNRLTEVALQMLGENFAEHGAETIERVRREKPHVYLQVVASLLPRQVQTQPPNVLADLTDEQLQFIEETLTANRAHLVQQIASVPPVDDEPSK
jgi:hypothetical protein